MSEKPTSEFEDAAQRYHDGNLITEFWDFLRHNKKWWLLPVLIVLLFLGALMLMSTTAAAPYIYTIF
jgi:Family of unknown function (DUF5989)